MWSREWIEHLMQNGKHFCLAPWVHLHVTGLGVMSTCSMSERGPEDTGYGSLNQAAFQELWQGEAIRNLRIKMLNDEPDPRCVNCYGNRLGHWTLRNEINRHYNRRLDWVASTDAWGFAPDAKPIFWDVRFSNVCNLKCRTCGDESSTSWFEDAKSLGNLDVRNQVKAINGIENKAGFMAEMEPYLPFLEGIRFAGGEPLLMDENYTILTRLDAMKKYDVRMEYETNMTQLHYKNHDLLSLWPKFKQLLISVSLDGLGAQSEYLRKGLDWDQVLNHFAEIKQTCPNAKLRINYTISAYNVLHLPDFHRAMVEQGHISAEQIQLICAVEPSCFSTRILTKELKRQATQKLKEHIRWLRRQAPFHDKEGFMRYADTFLQWPACIKHMNEEDWTGLIPIFKEYSNNLDRLRHENCLKVFPELKPLFDWEPDSKAMSGFNQTVPGCPALPGELQELSNC